MKSAILISCFVTLSLFAWSQPYIPLLGQTNTWHAVSCLGGCVVDSYGTAGDTTIGAFTYKVLGGYHYIHGNFLIREDVQERKVYMKTLGGHPLLEEYLLYDFSLEDGDSVNVYNPISPLPEDGGMYVLDSIISKPLENTNHRFFYLHAADPVVSGTTHTVWVEGVGSLSLINSPGLGPSEEDHLGCAFKDGLLQYADTDSIESCASLSSVQNASSSQFSVQPTLIGDGPLLIKATNERLVTVEVYDSSGRLIQVYSDVDANEISVPTQAYPKGLLLVRLIGNSGMPNSFKLFKK